MKSGLLPIVAASAALVLLTGQTAKKPLTPAPARSAVPWNQVVAVTPLGSHVKGNPAAKVKLTEYVSYTCPHCAHFTIEADGPIDLAWVSQGKVSVEIRHLLRDPIDATVAQLTNCGDKAKFFGNHTLFMRSQDKWIARYGQTSEAQRARWSSGSYTARRQAIARDFGFYEMMAGRGYSAPQLDRCLADDALAQRLVKQTEAAQEAGVTGTPSFALDGVLLAGTHEWKVLDPQIRARL